jgi:hypothetical protein
MINLILIPLFIWAAYVTYLNVTDYLNVKKIEKENN